MIALTRRNSSLTVFALIALVAALAMTIGTQDAHAAWKRCSLSESQQNPPGTKPTYNLSLYKQGTSCGKAKQIMKSFHKCRAKRGVRCRSGKRVRNWSCSGRKTSSGSFGFNARYTCRSGNKRVKGTYQQDR